MCIRDRYKEKVEAELELLITETSLKGMKKEEFLKNVRKYTIGNSWLLSRKGSGCDGFYGYYIDNVIYAGNACVYNGQQYNA